MTRRRKNEAKTPAKSPAKLTSTFTAIRKSSRQIAKKQLEEQKVNGEVIETLCSNNVESKKEIKDERNENNAKKTAIITKKQGKGRPPLNGKKAKEKKELVMIQSVAETGKIENESSQDDEESAINSLVKPITENVEESFLDFHSSTHEGLKEEIRQKDDEWSENIIEETIICKEMDVEANSMQDNDDNNKYSIAQDNTELIEQMLLIHEPTVDSKKIIELTVVENKDVVEKMDIDAYNDAHIFLSNSPPSNRNVENITLKSNEVDGTLIEDEHLTAPKSEINSMLSSSSSSNSDTVNKKDTASGKKELKCSKSKEQIHQDAIKAKKNSTRLREFSLFDGEEFNSLEKRSVNKRKVNLENRVVKSQISMAKISLEGKEIYRNTKESNNFISSSDNISNSEKDITKQIEKTLKLNENEDSELLPINKMENLDICDITDDKLAQEKEIKAEPMIENENDSNDSKIISNNLTKSKVLQESSAVVKIEKEIERLQNSEEHSRDSEMDVKIEFEDVKVSSSSENSNDTSASMSSCKISDFNSDSKSSMNYLNEMDKKPEFRSRSGSTDDTTGSESGSNSSTVRRSSRIRSIGLMKQRSRGRGLVTKPNVDVSKVVLQQDRDKVSNTSPIVQEQRDNLDVLSEIQSDKENSSNKSVTSLDISTPLTSISGITSGYDSDSSKPVKVKSRWRRSSELEMGSSINMHNARSSTFGPNITLAPVTEISFKGTINSDSEPSTPQPIDALDKIKTEKIKTESENGTTFTYMSTKVSEEVNTTPESSSTINNTPTIYSTASAQETIGSKISLPMVLEARDREMEERLSQFEYLKENLYLTDRFTNKETKRMVCDCFLTEEDIERGELGCGEDCLNRLLMIECGSRCVVGERCTNKRFQNCEYAKCEVFRTEKKGFGLRATIDLMAGEFIMEYVGEVVNPKDFRRRAKEYSKDKNRHYYFMALKSDQIIDATMKGNVSRFINHSCDPNAETQKWTVNGELRIGFFNKKFIAAGEEITFDYHFQRYGKEAQKCFCEAPNCRGWIGDNPDKKKEIDEEDEDEEEEEDEDEDEEEEEEVLETVGAEGIERTKEIKEKVVKVEKKAKRVKQVMKKKKEEKKPADYMEDQDLEEEIDKLCLGGLKNRVHTLTLSRLMVRSRELEHRTRLLRVIQSGEQPCRRLFLDYHGLRLIWSYMMDVAGIETEKAQQFRLEVLKTLITLPIPNKTMLMDSKVYSVVEKWAKQMYLSPNGDSPEDEQFKPKISNEEVDSNYDSNEKMNSDKLGDVSEKEVVENSQTSQVKQEMSEQMLITDLATNLLSNWSNLKEVFRIPKKERIEQMKEHEREADRGYKEELEKETRRERSYERHRIDRYSRNESERRPDRRRGRDSPDTEYSRSKDKRNDERMNLVPVPRMTKYERRQLFALKVAKEEEERQRRQQQELWQEHEARCLALGMDPHTTAALDPQTGYPLYFNQTLGQWQPYPIQDNPEITQQCPYIEGPALPHQVLPVQPSLPSQPPPHHLPQNVLSSGLSAEISSGVSPGVYSLNPPTSSFSQTNTPYPAFSSAHHQQYNLDNPLQMANNIVQVPNGTPAISVQNPSLFADKQPVIESVFPSNATEVTETEAPSSQSDTPPPLDLPPKWKWAKDDRGRIYYYHVKDRISQWLPPEPNHIGVQPDSSSSSESSEDSSSSNDEDEEEEEEEENEELDRLTQQPDEEMDLESTLSDSVSNNPKQRKADLLADSDAMLPDPKKRRDGLVQERIISPRRDEDRIDHKKYKEYKEKLKRQRERAKLKEHLDKSRKHRRSNKSKSHTRHSTSKLQSMPSECSPTTERRIKDAFRINMANVMVHFLNPYRKNDCKQGRITNTEDFKHLARKLTHFVLAKELKHCRSVDELQCNDNVKHKAKDFVRKYMSKFGPVYQKSTDED